MKDTATDIPSTEIQTIKLAQKGSWALPGVCTVRHTSCVSPAGATHNKNNTRKYYSLANLSLTFAPVTLLLGLSPLFDTTSTSSAQLTYLLTKTPSMALPVNSPMLQVEIFFFPCELLAPFRGKYPARVPWPECRWGSSSTSADSRKAAAGMGPGEGSWAPGCPTAQVRSHLQVSSSQLKTIPTLTHLGPDPERHSSEYLALNTKVVPFKSTGCLHCLQLRYTFKCFAGLKP